MRGRAGVLGRGAAAGGERGREALVPGLDRDADGGAQLLDEGLGLARLLAAGAAQGQRQADDDALRLLGADEIEQLYT